MSVGYLDDFTDNFLPNAQLNIDISVRVAQVVKKIFHFILSFSIVTLFYYG